MLRDGAACDVATDRICAACAFGAVVGATALANNFTSGAIRFVAIQGVVRRRPARGASRGDRGDHVPAGRVGHRERNRRALHPRILTTKAWTVIAINCATLPDQLVESELFGSNAAP
jgi:hypothetical protein